MPNTASSTEGLLRSDTGRHNSRSRLWSAYMERRYGILFYSLLLMLMLIPLASTLGLPQAMLRLFMAGCLLAAVMPSATRRTRQFIFVAVVLLVALRFAAESPQVPIHRAVPVVIVGITGLVAAAAALRFAVQSDSVTSETIYAALSTYLLAGLFFGQIYWAIETAIPGSFSGPDAFSEGRAVYYSFVTLATLGYGDFLPRTDLTRGIATFEVIGGQLFLAALVARLIGLFGPTGTEE